MNASDKILTALDAAENKQMAADALRRMVGLTMRGFRIVAAKMETTNLIHRENGAIQMTFGGIRRARILNDSWEG